MMKVEDLRKARNESPNPSFIEFIRLTTHFPHDLICFFENKDDSYYYTRIKTFVENYHSVKCGNKEKVVKVHELISYHKEHDKYKVAFFIDRDFDSALPQKQPPIYETPCYSIENLYASTKTFKEILKFHLGIAEGTKTFTDCIQLFVDRQKEFHQAVCLFNAWYACLKDLKEAHFQETKKKLDLKTTLGDNLPKNFVVFSLQNISQNYDLAKIEENFPYAPKITPEDLQNKIVLFEQCEQHLVFRGKYELRFVLDFIDALVKDANDTQNIVKEKLSLPVGEVGQIDRALFIFSSYAETPESLKQYLQAITKS